MGESRVLFMEDLYYMTTSDERFDQFFAWIRAFDPHLLANEAEVKPEFAERLFQYLGYPDGCRRHEYPLKTYEPGQRKKKPAIDLVYFSTNEREEQSADTSLVIVETKRPGEMSLDSALEQARFYGYHLTPLFLVATDAHRLRVLKRLGYRGEEQILNVTIGELREQATAGLLYRLLRFDVVKRLKEQLSDEVTHALYVDLMHALDHHPDLRAQLAKGDFDRSRSQEGRRLTVIEPKVAVVCDLPLAFGEGECRIEFSNLMLRGLTCHLTHRQILGSLMTGLKTQPHWGTRRFLRQTESGVFETHLGQTTVILSEQEAVDLCLCIDKVCHAYKASLVSAEEALETWEYRPVTPGELEMHGFHLLTVQPWLWNLLHRFAHEFDLFAGKTPWHMFDKGNAYLRVIHGSMDESVLIYPIYNLAANQVELIYCVEGDRSLAYEEARTGLPWKQAIGPKGRWTARHTEDWLVEIFIPHVLEHYATREILNPVQVLHWQLRSVSRQRLPVPLAQVNHPEELAFYVQRIQSWLHLYRNCRVAASLLQPYYAALTELVRHIDPLQLDRGQIEYSNKHIYAAEHIADSEQVRYKDLTVGADSAARIQKVHEIVGKLSEHVERICNVDHESPRVADYLSCIFFAFLEQGTIHGGQKYLNAAKKAVLPLLDLSRFEERYVLRFWE